jgi:3-hydroxypropionyl-coenzyme A dehydratase
VIQLTQDELPEAAPEGDDVKRKEHEKKLAKLLNKKLIEKSIFMAREITNNSYNAIKVSKYLINKGMDMDIDSGLRMEIYGWALCFAPEDRKNLMSSFLNKGKKK